MEDRKIGFVQTSSPVVLPSGIEVKPEPVEVVKPKTWREILQPVAVQAFQLAVAAVTAYLVSRGFLPPL